jgi:dihydroorotate dehydrogenase (fumarate)
VTQITNAAGDCKTLEQVQELARAPLDAVTLGSILHQNRPGNEGETFWLCDEPKAEGSWALNSRGLPCPGKFYYDGERKLGAMWNALNDTGKQFRISIAGFSPEDYEKTAAMAAGLADELEINLGCPNVWGEGGQKPIASFDLDLTKEIVNRVHRLRPLLPLAVKLSPYSDPLMLARMAELIKTLPVQAVVTCNTFPNALAFRKNGKQAISVGAGLAGLSGPALKPIALGQVRQFRDLLPSEIKVVGVGGIRSGQDVLDFVRAGADSVQVGTHWMHYGAKVFGEIMSEYADLQEAA